MKAVEVNSSRSGVLQVVRVCMVRVARAVTGAPCSKPRLTQLQLPRWSGNKFSNRTIITALREYLIQLGLVPFRNRAPSVDSQV